MSKRANLEEQDDSTQSSEKKLKLAENGEELDQEAEWAAFQALIGESETEKHETQQERIDIELADDEDSPDEEAEEENGEVTSAWDEDDMNVEKRLANQEARKKYLEQLRAHRKSTQDTESSKQNGKVKSNAEVSTATADHSSDAEEDGDDDDEDEGWIK